MYGRTIDSTMAHLPAPRTRGSCCSVEPAINGETAEKAAEWFGLLADPTRLSMLVTLRATAQPVCVCDFVSAYGLTQPTISHHMGKLRRAGLVKAQKRGLWAYYEIAAPLPALVEAVVTSLEDESRILRPIHPAKLREREAAAR